MRGDDRPSSVLAARRRRVDLWQAVLAVEGAISGAAVGRVGQWTARVVETLHRLREAIDEHVQVTEQPGGLHDDVMRVAPNLAARIQRLRDEHVHLRNAVPAVLARLRRAAAEDPWLPDGARDDVQRVLGKVVKHRQLGADLVWDAFAVDIGGSD